MVRKPGLFRTWTDAVVCIALLIVVVLWLVSPIFFIALELAN